MERQVLEPHSLPQNSYAFDRFAEPGFSVSFSAAFRDNIRQFLLQCANLEADDLNGMPIWCTFLVHENRVLPLYTVEEDVEHSDRPFCDYCRCTGWGHQYLSKRKYHFIIPGNEDWNKPLDEGDLKKETHLLHGLIHCNGFGHLILINGIEGGSKYICGADIMDLWDRICKALHARQMTVKDLSRKNNMDLRLFNRVAYGQTWFGRWGYRFCRGSFGVKEYHYTMAVEAVDSLKLDQVIDDFSLTNESTIKQMIQHYRDFSKTNLVTIRDLFRFMLTTKPVPRTASKFSSLAANSDSRWSTTRLEKVAEVIVTALEEKRAANNTGSCGMTRQEARDAARLHIGDTGLIDHVLKVLDNVIVGNYIVRRAVNRCTKVLEYTIQDFNGSEEVYQSEVLEASVSNNVAYLYRNVLLCYTGSDSVKSAVQTILDTKHFVKKWPFRYANDDSLKLICKLRSIDVIADVSLDFPLEEFIVVPLHATIGDLKVAVQNAMRDTYCAMEKLMVTEVIGMEDVQDGEVLFGRVESGKELRMRCCGDVFDNDFRYEFGTENRTVGCKCGAVDDDGEKMVECNGCRKWHHTRCFGIEDSQEVPVIFCDACKAKLGFVETSK